MKYFPTVSLLLILPNLLILISLIRNPNLFQKSKSGIFSTLINPIRGFNRVVTSKTYLTNRIMLYGIKEDRTLVKYASEIDFGLIVIVASNLIFNATFNYNLQFYITGAILTGFTYDFGFGWVLDK